MYKIIGSDQKEYGPVSAAQIRQWISDGRLNAATRAQREGTADWQPLSAFEEFADLFGTAPAAAPMPTGAPAAPVMSSAPTPTASREMALSAIKGPAIALIITGALGVAFYVLNTILIFSRLGHYRPIPSNATPFMRSFIGGMHGPGAAVFSLFLLVLNGFIVFGASRMLKLSGHTLAIITCIVAMIPCFSGICCVLGLPFAIWALLVLNKPEVKSQFTN